VIRLERAGSSTRESLCQLGTLEGPLSENGAHAIWGLLKDIRGLLKDQVRIRLCQINRLLGLSRGLLKAVTNRVFN
jgi:hypothetical protein